MLNEDISQRNLSFESYKERITNFSNEFELGLFLFILRRSLLWMMLCLLTAVTSALIYLRYTPSMYSSRTMLQLNESNNAQQVLSMNTFSTEDNNLQINVELMRSRFFIGMALQRMPLEVSYFNRGKILTEEYYTRSFFQVRELSVLDSAVMDVPVFLDLSRPERMGISYTIDGKLIENDFDRNAVVRMPHFSCYIDLHDHALLNDPEAQVNLYFLINSSERLVDRYAQRLLIKVMDANAKTVEISCQDQNSALAADLCQAMAQTFIDYDVERQGESALSVIHFIRSQKDTVFTQLRESEIRLQHIRIDNGVADLEQLTPIFLDRSKDYEDGMVKFSMEIELLKALEKATDKPLPEINSYDLVPLLIGTEFEASLSKTIGRLQELLAQRDALYLEATAEHQGVRSLEYQIDIQKRVVLESIGRLRETAEVRRDELQAHMSEFEGRFRALPEKELEYARIERVFNINEKYYTLLLEKDIEYRISKAGFVPENRILENATVATTPVSPNRNMVLVSYIVTGVILSFMIVLVRYILHDNITSLHDIAKLSNASIGILGMVPKYKKEIPISQLLIDKNPKSLIAEAFRSVRTNMQFVDNTDGAKIIAITSTISGEGKTFVAMNLAGIISYSGKRVIILDLDMRKPKIHLGFGVENVRGMSTLLIGKDSLESCIRNSTLENLDFITAGPIPPNPSELIISRKMTELLEELKSRYDVVLIDNPPVGLVTD
ncbi:MAG: polysaccharide biosynthesis tyrosine autokinase, partial [Flavobacteriales bacterium]